MTNFQKSISGKLRVKLTSAEPEAMLDAINTAGISINGVQRCDELSCMFDILRKDYHDLLLLVKKSGGSLVIIDEQGVFFLVKRLYNRPVLLWGILVILFLNWLLPTRILFVNVVGNDTVSDSVILEAAQESGIYFGASRREVRSEKVKNAILSEVPQLQWIGVNTAGCVATISVRERVFQEQMKSEKTVSSIVAARDGFILSGTVVRGNPLFAVGQTVKRGQVLISGYTDCGNHIQATCAEGEILAQTTHQIRAVTPSRCVCRWNLQSTNHKISLIIGKKRINLWNGSGILDSSCGRMYKEYYITLPGGFRLPISLCIESFFLFDSREEELQKMEVEMPLYHFVSRYLKKHMIAGEIQSGMKTVRKANGIYILDGCFICTEMIGREQQEQIGEANGKNN